MSITYSPYAIKDDGTVWSTGYNSDGQLGLDDIIKRSTFTKVGIEDAKDISCGYSHTLLMKNDGTLWGTGSNQFGQLGLGDTTIRKVFTKVDATDVKSTSCGYGYTLLMKNDGTLWATGYNTYGQLGLGDTTNRKVFTKVEIENVKSISCGHSHTYVIKNDGTVWATGANSNGQLGLGDATDRTTFTKVDITDVKSVVCGATYTVILKNDGTLWGTGYNNYGQLGLGDTTQRITFTQGDATDIKSVSCGSNHTLIIKNDGTVWCTGSNISGQLGVGDDINRSVFTKVDIDNVKSISCGYSHTLLMKNDGTLWGTGYNSDGQLGLGDNTKRITFTKVDIADVKSISDEVGVIVETFLYLIKTLQYNYTINKNSKTLSEITDTLTAQLIQSKGIDLDTINENIDILPDEFSLVSDKEFGLTIKGLKDNEQMIIASNDFLTTIKEHVDYFKSESTTTLTSKVKVIFSIDSGLTWKTYRDSSIVDTSIKIPCKAYDLLSTEELQEWNIAKSEILLNGIDASILETIDFNTIEFDKIRFAYAMSVEDIEDVASLSKLIWQFDSKGSMQQLKNTEYTLKVHSDIVEFKSLIDTDMIKVNILPNGIGKTDDIEFATDNEIDILFN